MDLASRLEQLEELVRDAKSMPLSSSVLVNRDEVLGMIAEMRGSLPEEIKRVRWIVRASASFDARTSSWIFWSVPSSCASFAST